MFKYLSPFLLYYATIASFLTSGFVVWLPLIYSWFIISLIELTHSDESNLLQAEEELAKKNIWYDVLLYMVVPFQYFTLGLFYM